jgi:segregation and condensation protein A
MTALLGAMPDWATLEQFLPEIRSGHPDTRLEHRAALARTLIAGLELARGGQLRLRQEAAFGPILVGRGAEALEDGA